MVRRRAGFTLLEVMFAILFISIGLFAYVALHTRILHSGTRLKDLEIERRKVASLKTVDQARAMYGEPKSVLWLNWSTVPDFANLRITTTTFMGEPPVPAVDIPLDELTGRYECDSWILKGAYDVGWESQGS